MDRQGIKHLVRCVCILPQLSKVANAPQHEFAVFSVLDEAGEFGKTFVQCPNCGIVHKIVDVCTSTICRGRDELSSAITLNDVRPSVSEKLAVVLEQNQADLPTWQHVAWILEEKRWGSNVVLTSEYVDGIKQGKVLTVYGETLFKISSYTAETVAGRE